MSHFAPKVPQRWPAWTSTHQSTSCQFYPLDGLHLVVNCAFTTIHLFGANHFLGGCFFWLVVFPSSDLTYLVTYYLPFGSTYQLRINPPLPSPLFSPVGVTQPPWLHQFRLGWTSVHLSYWTSCTAVRKVESKKVFAHPSTVNFFFTFYHPYSPNYPIYPPTLLILQWQNLYLFLTKFVILGKIYISYWLNFSNYILFYFWKVSQILVSVCI
jgi:hypothetical protein